MERRALLASAGSSLAALSGCFSSREGRGDPPTEETPVDETTTKSTDVTVESVVQQHGHVGFSTDVIYVVETDKRFLVASVAVEDGTLERGDFTLVVGETTHAPISLKKWYRTDWQGDQEYEAGREHGLLLFKLPNQFQPDIRLTWPSGEWQPGEGLRRRLQTPRQPMDATLDLPTEWDEESAPKITIEVTNLGDTEGRFLGVLNRRGPSYDHAPAERLSELVEAGETKTIEFEDEWYGLPPEENLGDGESDVSYHLDWADGSANAEMRLL